MNIVHCTFLILFLSCQQPETRHSPPPEPAFYHWKSTFAPTPADSAVLRETGVQTLYVRFFDVDWDETTRQPVPKAAVVFREKPAVATVVPVVFITNRTLLNLSPAEVPSLAQKLVQKVAQLAKDQGIRHHEIQLDCDWTRSTRSRYFALLRAIQQEAKMPLSATIRLHQVKFVAQTGVPPVARGLLMTYNLTDWKRPETRNSILDLTELRRYTPYLPGYPLPLDLALPLFRWTVVFRNNRVMTLLNNVDRQTLLTLPALTPQPDSMRFVVARDTMALGLSLRRGDLLRAEACSMIDLQRAKEEILAQLATQPRTFILYHLDAPVLHAYPSAALKALLSSTPHQTP
ncbi:hypothetical protein [Fibrella aquatilis]|uniref:Uncharacterized protein n=1 Tax=Fibrella aquatilis TaxID=2817059 RepID=A0A939G5Q7_9BACT|nr:hypothetical protein [Fibrella aquatilis]MBO0930707.1 hypothetical protein [Fibrella aquatilis]